MMLGLLIRSVLGIRLGNLYQYKPRTLSVPYIKAVSNLKDLPSISLVTPSFNQQKYIGSTIRSVLEQNYPNLNYIIQDACSTDGTDQILKSFAGNDIVDIRIEPDYGQTNALNRGFSGTLSEIMGYLNSDDILLPGTLKLVGRYFSDNPLVDVIYGNRIIINEDSLEVGRWILPCHDETVLRHIDYVPQESMFWRRQIWDRAGGSFDEKLHFAMDWDLILRFIEAEAVFHYVPELFGVFRVHENQKTQSSFYSNGKKEIKLLRSYHKNKNISYVKKILIHANYLYKHKKCDSRFRSSLVKRK
jgi:glycosyltransferase involved in cell wall biosynthesis